MGMSMESTHNGGSSTYKIELESVPVRIAFEAFVKAAEREASFSFSDIALPK